MARDVSTSLDMTMLAAEASATRPWGAVKRVIPMVKVSLAEVEENKYLPDRALTVLAEIRKSF
jgi:hypothetical protein